MEPTTPEETLEILHNIKDRYEEHHNVDYTDEAEACVHLTNRYMSDRYLPDKAIDALDEAGSRVHITNIEVPKNILDLETDLESIKLEKQEAISKQKFEDAATIRDKEKAVESKLEHAKNIWENQLKSNKELVTEVNVENVVSMMTGIPVQRVATHESNKLLNMPEFLKSNVIGQDDAVDKIVKALKEIVLV